MLIKIPVSQNTVQSSNPIPAGGLVTRVDVFNGDGPGDGDPYPVGTVMLVGAPGVPALYCGPGDIDPGKLATPNSFQSFVCDRGGLPGGQPVMVSFPKGAPAQGDCFVFVHYAPSVGS